MPSPQRLRLLTLESPDQVLVKGFRRLRKLRDNETKQSATRQTEFFKKFVSKYFEQTDVPETYPPSQLRHETNQLLGPRLGDEISISHFPIKVILIHSRAKA